MFRKILTTASPLSPSRLHITLDEPPLRHSFDYGTSPIERSNCVPFALLPGAFLCSHWAHVSPTALQLECCTRRDCPSSVKHESEVEHFRLAASFGNFCKNCWTETTIWLSSPSSALKIPFLQTPDLLHCFRAPPKVQCSLSTPGSFNSPP